jgi:hypothetical protein
MGFATSESGVMEQEETQSASDERVIQMRRVLLDVSPPSIGHHVSWVRAGDEVLLEIGYFDHSAVHDRMRTASNESGSFEMEWFVTDRFIFTRDHAARLSVVFGDLSKILATIADERRREQHDGE